MCKKLLTYRVEGQSPTNPCKSAENIASVQFSLRNICTSKTTSQTQESNNFRVNFVGNYGKDFMQRKMGDSCYFEHKKNEIHGQEMKTPEGRPNFS